MHKANVLASYSRNYRSGNKLAGMTNAYLGRGGDPHLTEQCRRGIFAAKRLRRVIFGSGKSGTSGTPAARCRRCCPYRRPSRSGTRALSRSYSAAVLDIADRNLRNRLGRLREHVLHLPYRTWHVLNPSGRLAHI